MIKNMNNPVRNKGHDIVFKGNFPFSTKGYTQNSRKCIKTRMKQNKMIIKGAKEQILTQKAGVL